MKTAAQMASAYQAAMSNPQTAANYTQGVQSVTTSPTQTAADPASLQRYVMGTQQAVASGRMAAALQAVTLQQWQTAATQKGAPRLASGAQAASAKVSAFFQKWAPIYAQASQAAKALPKGGMANALARVQAAIQVMMSAAGKTA
jgi:hypothetical protein